MRKRRRVGKFLWGILSNTILLFFIGLALWIHVVGVGDGTPIQLRAVLTGSMHDAFPAGSLVVTRPVPTEDLEVGDIITYRSNGATVSHRIESINQSNEFITKGDSNSSSDREPVAARQIHGRVLTSVPKLGRWLMVLQSDAGRRALLLTILQILLLEMFLKLLFERECVSI